MRRWLIGLVAAAAAATPTAAALPTGAAAPDFVTTGAVGGKAFRLHLAEQLRKGPVVLYFFPKAFTKGCTLEAHAFSEAAKDFRKAGARVIGMSADDLPTLKRFSVEACRNAFPVATATPGRDQILRRLAEAEAGADRPDVLRDRSQGPDRSSSTRTSSGASMCRRPSRPCGRSSASAGPATS